ncbi:4a-hydroxytetrahydrobiopterin dehydratase [Microbacteriaceae bacterium 4G12]
MTPLQTDEVQQKLLALPKWILKDKRWIERKYLFQEFLQGIQFVNQIAAFSEEKDHHPFITIQYKVVVVSLTSWNAKGLTALDFQMAEQFDTWYEEIKLAPRK